jgi:putative cell wall-binding protein
MKKMFLLFPLAGAVLLCGCNKQNKINGEKIELLSQKIVQLEQIQAKQGAEIQSELKALAPTLDKMDSTYFEKTHEDAFFYHTNTLYLLLTVERKIESQLQVADTEREAENALAYYYHTNQTDTMYFCTAQIQTAMEAQEKRIEDNVNAETRQAGAALGEDLLKQFKLSDDAQTVQDKEMAEAMAQIQRDLEQIKIRLGITNPPASGL